MSRRNALKLVHLASSTWFMLSAGYILVFALRQANINWWVIFSLSGYSALLISLLVSLYLFAIFRGAGRSQKIEAEHPLTTTNYYMMFYMVAPFLGGLAGCLGMTGARRVSELLLGIALGTLATTFLVWIVVDPAAGLLEMLLPEGRKHRAKRLAQIKALREKRQEQQKRLLAEILTQEERDRCRWEQALRNRAFHHVLRRGCFVSERFTGTWQDLRIQRRRIRSNQRRAAGLTKEMSSGDRRIGRWRRTA